ncbi:MAG TPA: aldehyde dehydrogenase family protein [Bacteroidales bacterium]|nr:aldehyde dehydrogenase family protein [Bacteroidales bacterium]HPS17273.1 aldehyde dehydrogenase family protein [Bacteroidales bacterium]
MKEYKIYAGGEFITSSEKIGIYNSYDHKLIAETYLADKKILERSIQKALAIERELAELPAYTRYEILMQIADEIKNRKAELAEILAMEAAKPLKYAIAEIQRAYSTFVAAAEEAKRPPMEFMRLDWEPTGKGKEGLVKYFPVGLVAGISPFNFPMNLAVHKIAPAIAAGCPIILKPARSTPLSTLELAGIIDKTALPKGAISILPMDRIAGNQLVTDERFKLLTFTGSPAVGWKMKTDAGKKKVVLELGGNAGVIVTKSADIEHAVKRCIVGAFAYAGQVCIHTQRIFVAKEIINEFTKKFIEQTKALKAGPPNELSTDITSMIDEENAQRVEQWVSEAVSDGAKILCGGKRNNTFFEPTVMTNTKNEMKVSCQEIFGPVVILDSFEKFEDAVNKVNNSIFGLQAGVFTNNINELNYAFANIQVGGVIHNDVSLFRVDHMPYGGVKESGLGREGVKYAMLDMMEPKILVKSY